MSDTPRTDAIANEPTPSGSGFATWRMDRYQDLARQLERALAASEERVAQLTKERDALRDDVKILRVALSIYRVPPV